MLQLQINQASEKIILTLDELKTLDEPNYLFVFTHVLTKQQVSFVRLRDEEESSYPSRFNQFSVSTSTVFANKPVGEWHYSVYEQESEDNTDTELSTALIEQGKMMLLPAAEFEQTKYDQPTSFKTYNG